MIIKKLYSHLEKCNLGKVNFEAMLVISFSSYTRSGQIPLEGAPQDILCSCLLAVLRKVLLQLLAVCVPFCALVFSHPSLALEVRAR